MDNEEVMWSHPADVMWLDMWVLKRKTDNNFIF